MNRVNKVRLFRHITGFVPAPNGGNTQYVGFDIASGNFFELKRDGTLVPYPEFTMATLREYLSNNRWIEIDASSPDGSETI